MQDSKHYKPNASSNLLIKFSPVCIYSTLEHILFGVYKFLYICANKSLPRIPHDSKQKIPAIFMVFSGQFIP